MFAAKTRLLVLLLLLVVVACNTAEGVGKDVEAGGEVISDTARETKRKM